MPALIHQHIAEDGAGCRIRHAESRVKGREFLSGFIPEKEIQPEFSGNDGNYILEGKQAVLMPLIRLRGDGQGDFFSLLKHPAAVQVFNAQIELIGGIGGPFRLGEIDFGWFKWPLQEGLVIIKENLDQVPAFNEFMRIFGFDEIFIIEKLTGIGIGKFLFRQVIDGCD